MESSLGAVLGQARELRELSLVDVARTAGISAAYLSKLENDDVKRPSPNVLHQLSLALALPYADLMRRCGYPMPGDTDGHAIGSISAAFFAAVTDDEREELMEYLAWYRTRRRSRRGGGGRR